MRRAASSLFFCALGCADGLPDTADTGSGGHDTDTEPDDTDDTDDTEDTDDTDDTDTEDTAPGDRPPVITVDAEIEAGGGDDVTLDASASSDPEGVALGFSWEQTGGPPVEGELSAWDISDPTAPTLLGAEGGALFGELVLQGDTLHVTASRSQSWDVSDPATPRAVTTPSWVVEWSATEGRHGFGGAWQHGALVESAGAGRVGLAGLLTVPGAIHGYFPGDGVEWLATEAHGLYGVAPLPKPSVGPALFTERPGAAVEVVLSWEDREALREPVVTCHVGGGSCEVLAVDQVANTATIRWVLPDALGTHDLVAAISDSDWFSSGRAWATTAL